MKLNFAGRRPMELRKRVRVISIVFIPAIIIAFNGLLIFLMARGFYMHLRHVFLTYICSSIVLFLVDVACISYFYGLVMKTRRQIRHDFNITTRTSCDDCCLSLFCTPCVITQMGQHTADYTTYAGFCCSDTGLSQHIEVKFPKEIPIEDVYYL